MYIAIFLLKKVPERKEWHKISVLMPGKMFPESRSGLRPSET
jgi:hypothetical protein